MLPRNHPEASKSRLTTTAWWPMLGSLPVTLAHHLGLYQLVQERLDLGNASGPGQHRRQGA